MTEAEGVKAEINNAIDHSERAHSTLIQLQNELDLLLAQTLIIGGSGTPKAAVIALSVEKNKQLAEEIGQGLWSIERRLNEWLTLP